MPSKYQNTMAKQSELKYFGKMYVKIDSNSN